MAIKISRKASSLNYSEVLKNSLDKWEEAALDLI